MKFRKRLSVHNVVFIKTVIKSAGQIMEFKVLVICYTLFGFCQEIFCVQVMSEGCETAPQNEMLEMANNEMRPKTDKKRVLLAVPVINTSDKSGKRNKEMPFVTLKVLKPKSKISVAQDRNFSEPSRILKASPPITHVDEIHIKPIKTDKTLDDYEIKENELKDDLVDSRDDKTIEFIHENVGYVEKDQTSSLEVPKLNKFESINNLNRPIKFNEVYSDVKETNPEDFHKQVRTRSLENKIGNIYEEVDPVDPKLIHAVITPTEQSIPELMSIIEANKPLVDEIGIHRVAQKVILNDSDTESGVNDQLEQTSKLEVQTVEVKQDNVQNADYNNTTADSILRSGYIKIASTVEKEPAIMQIKKENDNAIGNDVIHHDDQNKYVQPTATKYQPTLPHYNQPTNLENQEQQYRKYHLYPIYNEAPSYASPVVPAYNIQAETQPYQYIPVYDSPSRWYDPENLAFYDSNPINSNQVTGHQHYIPLNSNHVTGYPQYNAINSNQATNYPYYNSIKNYEVTRYPQDSAVNSNQVTGYTEYYPINNYQATGYPNDNAIYSNQVTGYPPYNLINSNQVNDYPQYIETVGYNGGNEAYSNPLNDYNTNNQPTYYETANAYQNQPYITNVSPQSYDLNPYKPDFVEALPPFEYPFETELGDLHLDDNNNYNLNHNYRTGVWRIPNCNHYYHWYRKPCRIQPRSYYRPYRYYYGVPNKYTTYPNWRNLQKRRFIDGYFYVTPYQMQSNQNLYSLQNKKDYNQKSKFPKYYEVTRKL